MFQSIKTLIKSDEIDYYLNKILLLSVYGKYVKASMYRSSCKRRTDWRQQKMRLLLIKEVGSSDVNSLLWQMTLFGMQVSFFSSSSMLHHYKGTKIPL